MNIVALIPARGGSRRIPRKNIKLLGGKPLIQWTIDVAKASGVFTHVVVPTDDDDVLHLAAGQAWPYRRSESADTEPDITWIRPVVSFIDKKGGGVDAFAILRPTSPFRTADTIRRAVKQFAAGKCSSIRAVERVKQHPGKMWQMDTCHMGPMEPLMDRGWPTYGRITLDHGSTPWHSQPTQSLPTVYIQNSSLEIAWTWCVTVFDSISGPKVAPFFTEGMEGFSLDYPEDWDRAERYVADLQTHPAAQ